MVTTLYLIRHGQTEDGAKRYIGSMDIPLSETGILQITSASNYIVERRKDPDNSRSKSYLFDIHSAPQINKKVVPERRVRTTGRSSRETAPTSGGDSDGSALAAVYCSDLSRAARSAEIIAAPHRLVPIKVPAFRERSFGIWEGMSFLEIKKKYPREFELWAGNPVQYSPVGGESTVEVKERVLPQFNKIMKKHSGEDIAIVAHGGINRIILCSILGIPLENIFRIEQDCASVNIIEFWDKYPVVKLMNYTT